LKEDTAAKACPSSSPVAAISGLHGQRRSPSNAAGSSRSADRVKCGARTPGPALAAGATDAAEREKLLPADATGTADCGIRGDRRAAIFRDNPAADVKPAAGSAAAVAGVARPAGETAVTAFAPVTADSTNATAGRAGSPCAAVSALSA
jgi:hypothetical protein